MIERPVDKPPKRKLPAPFYGIHKKIRTRNMDPETIRWEDYLIPGMAEDVLRNKVGLKHEPYGCTDFDLLIEREERFTAFRMIELKKRPIEGNFDFEHMKRIHHHLFQDVYHWAGQPRNVDLNKAGYVYASPQHVEPIWEAQHQTLVEDDLLRGITDPEEFADRLAFHWGMVNLAHAFREGNTRSQVVFFHQLADQAGWELDVSKLGPDHPESIREEFIDARFHHQSTSFDHKPLAQVLAKAITRKEPELEHTRQRYVGRQLLDTIGRNLRNAPPPYSSEQEYLDRYRRFPELVPENPPRHRAEPEEGFEL